jgi:hypothetical protein
MTDQIAALISDKLRFIILFLVLYGAWRWIAAQMKKGADQKLPVTISSPWARPPVMLGRAARAESFGLSPAPSISTTPTSTKEIHMNPISAVVFILFIGGAALARVANMPIWISVVPSRWPSNGNAPWCCGWASCIRSRAPACSS